MPRPKIYNSKSKLSPEQLTILERCAGYGLTLEEIAHILGVGNSTLKRRMTEDETTKEAYQKGRAVAKELVVGKLFDLIRKGEPSAIFFYLKCQCGWREKEKDVVETTATPITIYLPEKETDASK